jgi:hypothetical protein
LGNSDPPRGFPAARSITSAQLPDRRSERVPAGIPQRASPRVSRSSVAAIEDGQGTPPPQPARLLGGARPGEPKDVQHPDAKRVQTRVHDPDGGAGRVHGGAVQVHGAAARGPPQPARVAQQEHSPVLRGPRGGGPADPHAKGPVLLHVGQQQHRRHRALRGAHGGDGRAGTPVYYFIL